MSEIKGETNILDLTGPKVGPNARLRPQEAELASLIGRVTSFDDASLKKLADAVNEELKRRDSGN